MREAISVWKSLKDQQEEMKTILQVLQQQQQQQQHQQQQAAPPPSAQQPAPKIMVENIAALEYLRNKVFLDEFLGRAKQRSQ